MLLRNICTRARYSGVLRTWTRTFLSREYKCSSEWESRLASPLMQKVKLDSFYHEIDQEFNQQEKASAIDIDIFVNKVNDDQYMDEVNDLVHRLRMTTETSNSLESTGHAVIRNLADHNHFDDLIQILDNPLGYGVFLDSYLANYIMSDCIKNKNFFYAARIATFLMLQEDFDNELSQSLAIYSCYNYLSDPKPFYPKEETKDDEPKEEKKVRVKFIRNEFFDDHFDLRDNWHLVGKTLAMAGAKIGGNVGKSVEFLGQVLYQKYEKAMNILKASSKNIHEDILKKSVEFLNNLSPDKKTDIDNELHALLLEKLSSKDFNNNNFTEELETRIKDSVLKNEKNEIENQKKVYNEWNKIREQKFNEEMARLQRVERLKHIEKITKEMKEEEQRLWFFDNEEDIDLEIDRKKAFAPKKFSDNKQKSGEEDEEYIPPEIIKKRK